MKNNKVKVVKKLKTSIKIKEVESVMNLNLQSEVKDQTLVLE